jgi:glutamate carboxypeptidase
MPTDTDRRIRAHLETRLEAYLRDLGSLVNRDCGTDDKAGVDGVVDYLAGRLADLGAEIERRPHDRYGDMLLARWPGAGEPRILLSGHTDTVYPPGTAAERPMRRGADDPNRLYGPGTADMKSGILTGMYAVAALRDLGLDDWAEVAFVLGSEEERGSPVSRHWLRSLAPGYDAGLVLEAGRSNGDVVTGRKGGGFWRVTVAGKAAHAGVEPEKGASAFLQIVHHALALDAINGTIPGATIVLGTARAGEAPNMVPPHAEMTVDGRALTPEGLDALSAAVDRAIEETRGRVPGTQTTVKGDVVRATMPRTPANLHLYELARDAAQAQGFDIGEQVSGGTSDGNFLADAGLPVLDGLGPVGTAAHSPEEHILVDTIVPRTAMLAGLIARLTGGATG